MAPRPRTRFSLPLPIALLGLWTQGLVLLGTASYHLHLARQEALHHATNEQLEEMEDSLNALLRFATHELMRMQQPIRHSGGDLNSIRAILAEQINKGHGVVRFSWIDNANLMRVSSVSGIREKPYDLSSRHYIQQARATPFQPIISRTLTHKITHTPVMVVALGIESFSGSYLGTLNAAFNYPLLIDRIQTQLSHCRCYYHVLAPHHEVVIAQGATAPSPLPAAPRFTVSGSPDRTSIAEITHHFGWVTGVIAILFSALCLIAWLLISKRLILPMLRWVGHSQPPSSTSSLKALQQTEHFLHQMSEQGTNYTLLAAQLQQTQLSLSEALERIETHRTREAQLTQATGHQMHEACAAITAYSDHIEELIAIRLLNPDARYDYDEVAEMGQNLHHLATCLRGMDAVTAPITPEQFGGVLVSAIGRLHAAAERRNITLAFTHTPETSSSSSSSSKWESLIYCIVYDAIRHSQDEATLTIDWQPHPETTRCTLTSTAVRSRLLLPRDQDFSRWVSHLPPSHPEPVLQHYQQQANWLIAQAVCEQVSMNLSITMPTPECFEIRLCLSEPSLPLFPC